MGVLLLVWAAGWTAGFELGLRSGRDPGVPGGVATVRALQAAPVLGTVVVAPVGLTLCLTAGLTGGWAVASDRSERLDGRAAHAVDAPLAPSRRLRWCDRAVLRTVGWPSVRDDRWRVPAVLLHAVRDRAPPSPGPASGESVLLSGEGPPPPPGALLAGRLESTVPTRASHEGGFDRAGYLLGRGVTWTARLGDEARRLPADGDPLRFGAALNKATARVESSLVRLYPPPEAALLRSVLLGRRDDLARVPRDVLTQLGLGHVFAVSGLHVGILAAVAAALLGVVGAGPTTRFTVLSGVFTLYVVVTGMAASTVRAALMGAVVAGAAVCGRRAAAVHTLALVFWATQVWRPESIADVGLRLSFLAVAGILVAARATPRPSSRILRWGLAGLGVSGGALLATAPVAAPAFGRIPPFAPLINLLGLPLFGCGVWLGVLSLLTTPLAWISEAVAAWGWLALRLFAGTGVLAHGLLPPVGAAPEWTIGRLIVWAGGWLLIVRGRGAVGIAGLVATTAAVFLPVPADQPMTALQADVGQGDAAVLVFPDRTAVAIDVGVVWRGGGSPFTRDVLPWLRRRGVDRLAGVVLTHHHDDHDGAAQALTEAMRVERWWLGGRCRAPEGEAASRPTAGETLHDCAPWRLVCLANADSSRFDGENDRSLVVGLFRDDRLCGLWTGDREAEGEADLLTALPQDLDLEGGVWKAGHHGSRTSGTAALLDRLRPSWIVASCGVENRHRHPSHAGYDGPSRSPRVLRTDLAGGVLMVWDDAGSLSVNCARDRVPVLGPSP